MTTVRQMGEAFLATADYIDKEQEYERLRLEEDKLLLALAPTPKVKKPKKIVEPPIDIMDGRNVLDCNLCPKLCDSRSQIVNGYGPAKAKYAVIAESPNEQEDDQGRPFVATAGQTFKNWMVEAGIRINREVYYDNAVKCHPDLDKKPTEKEIKRCNEHLMQALESVQPDVIIACGNGAILALLPPDIAHQGITKVRGHVFWNERLQCKVVPTFHPSSALFDFDNEFFCKQDIKKAVVEAANPDVMTNHLGKYEALLTVEAVEKKCRQLKKADIVVFDTETTHSPDLDCVEAGDAGGLDWLEQAEILCLGLTDRVGHAWIIPFLGKEFREIWTPEERERVWEAVRDLFESGVPLLAQNMKFDLHILRSIGIEPVEKAYDTMLAYGLIREASSHALEPMRSLFTTMPFYDDVVYAQTDGKRHMERADEAIIWEYCGADVDCTLRVAIAIDALIDKEDPRVRWIFENITMPLLPVLTRMEEHGVLIDMELANQVIEDADKLIAEKELEFYSALPSNWQNFKRSSHQQLKKLLYVDLKLPLPPILTDTGAKCKVCRDRKKQHWYHTSTNKDALRELEGFHPCIRPLVTLNQLATLKKTFLLGTDENSHTGLLQHVRSDGRIHTSFRQDIAETGRLSSSPNLQNIPKDTDERPEIYKLIRKLFIAPPGRKLLECDFSQIELRILAYISGQEDMITKFENNEDFHLYSARNVLFTTLDPHLDDATWKSLHKDRRDRAKVFNFGVPYGLTAWGIAQRFGCTEEEGASYITSYMKFFTRVFEFFRRSDRDVKYKGQRKNAFGRTRHFEGVKSMRHFAGYRRIFSHMKREAYNYPIQSTASDVLSLALIRIFNDPWYEENECYLVLTVHDSLTLEVPEDKAEECARRTLAHMEVGGREHLGWYLPAECKWGQRWSDWEMQIELEPGSHEGVLSAVKRK